ncbi:magnesium/cobalt transporter CorA [Flavobacterium salilacus subsp. salilacus]|uniref:magnesium/cobalt transporter CorA n=1 Tax=Flavobacterium TaxID=237 RepID=UPI001074BF33|nr:magnesium/cobalt transporter CorA [Flavobacterium salilacus]KAF2516273.1 magnesium/cobalt transporter CorA [Flavobacterium salilacus subsp. salilacus]MBE1613803.1 magnesium/cobalt transporter CorA [Flavobacterium sp. SaA2.13]NDI99950.1 magnesium/cobalt transporter CorA [Flavobacterium salilacus subsp. altitudinum]
MKKIKYKKVRKVQPNNFEYTGKHKTNPVEMQLFVYDESKYEELKNIGYEQAVKKCTLNPDAEEVRWFNVHGLHNVELIRNIGESLKVENIIIDDILNTSRRTRIEELEDVLFFSVKSILPEEEEGTIKTEQISFLLKDNLIVSFQEKKSDYFTHIRERIRTGTGIIRKKKSDYLLYLMLDAIMENFFITIEKMEDNIEALIIEAKTNYKADIIAKVEKLRETLSYIKRSITPLKDALFNLKNVEQDDVYQGIRKTSYTFFARLHQKSLELLDQVEYDLNSLESVSNYHYSAQTQRMNQIMKTLTIYSVIFMPITFIVGVYGMNFDNMPELHTENGYYVIISVMVAITLIMVIYFKIKDWF